MKELPKMNVLVVEDDEAVREPRTRTLRAPR